MKIGIDCGSLTVKGVLMDEAGRVVAREHVAHAGELMSVVRRVLFSLLDGHDPARVRLALTGAHSATVAAGLGIEPMDPIAAEVAGCRRLFGRVDHVIHIGGASLALISLDPDGNLLGFSTNTNCAAGTGSFLDEQAARMGMSHEDAAEVAPMACPPPIATRCAVFAKTDLIHRQQEGFGRDALWCGLCKGMSHTAVQTLLKGRSLNGAVAMTGGVAANPGMVHYLEAALGRDVLVSPDSPVCAAAGAAIEGESLPVARALEALTRARAEGDPWERGHPGRTLKTRQSLVLERSRRPDFLVSREWTDVQGNEIRCHVDLGPGTEGQESTVGVFLGVDIGSTSTKAALVDANGNVLMDVYRRTEGDPVGASRKLMAAIQEAANRLEMNLDVTAVGTTGSGRKIVGMILGADLVVNEISAHVRGAVSVDPGVTTIFEIGGQDSKYMRVRDGRIVDANMNYVCAAGTGTFVEELGRKLGFSLEEIGEQALGISPPHTSDRCTVFMEQDAHNLAREGASRREVMASILFSVIENYKTKVVGNRPVDRDRVVFQGATARNMGLVAAVENVFGVEVVVSPFCHVTGAIGAALLAADEVAARGGETAFRGLDLARREVGVTTSTCDLCSNKCVISTAHIEGVEEEPSFGYLCGREPSGTRMRKNVEYQPFRRRKALTRQPARTGNSGRPGIGIPLALATHGYTTLFSRLIEGLGGNPVFSAETDRATAALGASTVASDFCFPVKIAHGHVAALLARDDLDAVFVPAMVEETRNAHTTRARFCPYLQALPSLVKPMADERPPGPALVAPVLDFNQPDIEVGRHLAIAFAGVMDIEPEEAASAWRVAVAAQRQTRELLVEEGRGVLARLKTEGKKGIVIIGRPYNTLDPVVSMKIPQTVSESGFTVIPMDMLPFDPAGLGPGLTNMYWNYGQRILSAVKTVADDPDLYGIFLSSFNCGPDSFILSLAEHVMGGKPFLVLELDEHGSDGGYATRIEAFLDVVRGRAGRPGESHPVSPAGCRPDAVRGRILWIPPIHPVNSRLFAAVFRGFGFQALALPATDEEAHALGKAATRGSECTPMALTLGVLLKSIRDSGLPPERHALFMPTATGPCRFGSYALAQHLALERMGMGSIPVFSPSSENSYYGIPTEARKLVWDAILCGDYLYKMRLDAAAREQVPGSAERMLDRWVCRLEEAFESREDPLPLLARAAMGFKALARRPADKPLVGIVGEIYVRCDPFANSFVIRSVEENGGEAWLAPFSEWILYTAWAERVLARVRGVGLVERLMSGFANLFIERREHEYTEQMRPFLESRMEPPVEEVIEEGLKFVPREFEGESVLTVGRAVKFLEQGADLVVNVAPFGCMHGHISGALFEKVSREFGRPIVTSFYDAGTANSTLRSFVKAAIRRRDIEQDDAVSRGLEITS